MFHFSLLLEGNLWGAVCPLPVGAFVLVDGVWMLRKGWECTSNVLAIYVWGLLWPAAVTDAGLWASAHFNKLSFLVKTRQPWWWLGLE